MCAHGAKAWRGYRRRDSDEEHPGSDDAAPTNPLEQAHNYSLVAVTPRCTLPSAGEVGLRAGAHHRRGSLSIAVPCLGFLPTGS